MYIQISSFILASATGSQLRGKAHLNNSVQSRLWTYHTSIYAELMLSPARNMHGCMWQWLSIYSLYICINSKLNILLNRFFIENSSDNCLMNGCILLKESQMWTKIHMEFYKQTNNIFIIIIKMINYYWLTDVSCFYVCFSIFWRIHPFSDKN